MYRFISIAICCSTLFLLACAGPAPEPEPGMEVLQHARGEEMQVAADVDWGSYTKIILHNAPVAFIDGWRSNQERLHGKALSDEDVERFASGVSDQMASAIIRAFAGRGGYEMTSEPGPGVMVFQPNIVDLDITATGWVQNSILESLPDSRGRMTTEMVIRDSVTDELLAVAWQNQTDPRQGEMELTVNVNNTQAMRLMLRNFADWLHKQLEKTEANP